MFEIDEFKRFIDLGNSSEVDRLLIFGANINCTDMGTRLIFLNRLKV
jgi:hypothetical protein